MKKLNQRGITLIALVITIIVLLILAGVSIAMLTGQNGILTQANNAKALTANKSAEEKVKLAVMAARSQSETGALEADKLVTEVTTNYGGQAETTAGGFPVTVTIDGKSFIVDENGTVELSGAKPQVTEAKVVTSADGTGNEAADDQAEGTTLYISFKTSLENGTISSVTCDKGTVENKNGIYVTKVTANGTYTFTITGTGENGEVTSTIPIKVSKYESRSGIKVGDYVNYTPNVASTSYSLLGTQSGYSDQTIAQESLKWRVLRKNADGSIDLIADPTSKNVYFKGALGYNNGVYLLNDICEKLYSNTGKNVTARSVNLDDMEKWLTDAGKNARANYSNVVKYGETKPYTGSNAYRPDIYGKTENENDKYYSAPTTNTYTPESGKATASDTLDAKQTYYNISINSTNYGDGAKVLNNSNYYWVAARYVYCGSDNAYFGLRLADTNMNGNNMFYSYYGASSNAYRLRPVVSLRSDVQITPSTGTNGTDNPHTIDW